jgi:hypothetical protein
LIIIASHDIEVIECYVQVKKLCGEMSEESQKACGS